MPHRSIRRALTLALSCAALAVSAHGQPPPPPAAAVDQRPPRNLRPLLSPRQSEMRLVTVRYTLDRETLAGNYLGGMRVRGPRRGEAAAPRLEPLSPGRIARLERFDLDWLAALDAIDASTLTPAARADLAALKATIASNTARLRADAVALARLSPYLPFAPAIVGLVGSRIRLEDVAPEKAAGVLTAMTRAAARARARTGTELASRDEDDQVLARDYAGAPGQAETRRPASADQAGQPARRGGRRQATTARRASPSAAR